MESGGKLEFAEDFANMNFSQLARLGMSLQSMQDWKDLRPIKHLSKAMLIPLSVGIIDSHMCRCLRWDRPCTPSVQ